MWAREKGWLLPNDTGSRSTCGTVQVAQMGQTGGLEGLGHHWKVKTYTWISHCRRKVVSHTTKTTLLASSLLFVADGGPSGLER